MSFCEEAALKDILTLVLLIMFCLKMLSAYSVCCINSNALQNTFTMRGSAMAQWYSA